MRVASSFNNLVPASNTYPPIITGNSSFSSIAGVFNASGISFTGSPGYNYGKNIITFIYFN